MSQEDELLVGVRDLLIPLRGTALQGTSALHSEAGVGIYQGQGQRFNYFTGLWVEYVKTSHKSVIFRA